MKTDIIDRGSIAGGAMGKAKKNDLQFPQQKELNCI